MKDKFKAHFQLPQDGFSNPIDLNDTNIGFSLYKDRSVKGFKSLFRVFIKNEELDKQETLKPIIVTASYGKETTDGITISSTEFKRKINWPIEFISEGEFFYNKNSDKLYFRDKEINGIDLLKKSDDWHIKPTKPLKGALLRIELLWFHFVVAGFWEITFKFVSAFQYLISGEKIKIFHNLTDPNSYRSPSFNRPLEIKKSELISLWGYEVKPWIAGIYAFTHLSVYFYLYHIDYRPLWLTTIFKNSFLTLVYGILSLGLANTFLPILLSPINLKGILKLIQNMYWKSITKKIKI